MERPGKFVLRLIGMILGTTALISLAVLLIGYFLQWDDPFKFSNGFFMAGAILIVLGILSVTGGFTQRSNFGMLYSESAGQMNTNERNQRMLADMAQRYSAFVLLLVSGLLLMGISVALGSLF